MHEKAPLHSRLLRLALAATFVAGAAVVAHDGVEIAHGYPGMPAACSAPGPNRAPLTPANASARTQATYAALENCYSVDGGTQFRGEYLPQSTLWPDTWAISALLTLQQSPNPPAGLKQEITARLDGLQRYWNGGASPPGYDPGIPFLLWGHSPANYDDNDWAALDFLDAYRLWKNPTFLEHAKQVFALELHGWDGNPRLPHPGGVKWTQIPGDTSRATVSTAGAALLGANLYELTGDRTYLDWSLRMTEWIETTLRGSDGLFHDNINAGGDITSTQWSYNQGLVMAVYTSLYQATGDRHYLESAQTIAATCVASFNRQNGPADFASANFDAKFFKYLMALDEIAPDPAYGAALTTYAQRINANIDPATGVFHSTDRSEYLLNQSAALQILALYETQVRAPRAPAVPAVTGPVNHYLRTSGSSRVEMSLAG